MQFQEKSFCGKKKKIRHAKHIGMGTSYLSRLQIPRKVAHGLKESMEMKEECCPDARKHQQIRQYPACIILHEEIRLKKKENLVNLVAKQECGCKNNQYGNC